MESVKGSPIRGSRENPLVALRESAGLTVTQLASLANVTPTAIVRAEQAVYASPPPHILNTLWRYAPEDDLHDQVVFTAEYLDYQRNVRQANYGALDEPFNFPMGGDLDTNPFVSWRLDSDNPHLQARIGVSKLYCVHPALVFKFEVQPHLCASVPGALRYALLESGYSKATLDSLETAYGVFKENGRERKKLSTIEYSEAT